MMAEAARYTLHPAPGGGAEAPIWLLASPVGDWYDPDDQSYIGVAPTIETLDAAEFLARAQSINARHPITDPDTGTPYTDAALEAAVTAWISAAGA